MDEYQLTDYIVWVALAFIGWQFKLIFEMKMEQVRQKAKIESLEESMNKGSERFGNIETELKGIRKDITTLIATIKASVWKGVGEENPRLPD